MSCNDPFKVLPRKVKHHAKRFFKRVKRTWQPELKEIDPETFGKRPKEGHTPQIKQKPHKTEPTINEQEFERRAKELAFLRGEQYRPMFAPRDHSAPKSDLPLRNPAEPLQLPSFTTRRQYLAASTPSNQPSHLNLPPLKSAPPVSPLPAVPRMAYKQRNLQNSVHHEPLSPRLRKSSRSKRSGSPPPRQYMFPSPPTGSHSSQFLPFSPSSKTPRYLAIEEHAEDLDLPPTRPPSFVSQILTPTDPRRTHYLEARKTHKRQNRPQGLGIASNSDTGLQYLHQPADLPQRQSSQSPAGRSRSNSQSQIHRHPVSPPPSSSLPPGPPPTARNNYDHYVRSPDGTSGRPSLPSPPPAHPLPSLPVLPVAHTAVNSPNDRNSTHGARHPRRLRWHAAASPPPSYAPPALPVGRG